jgi:hypothetical protein
MTSPSTLLSHVQNFNYLNAIQVPIVCDTQPACSHVMLTFSAFRIKTTLNILSVKFHFYYTDTLFISKSTVLILVSPSYILNSWESNKYLRHKNRNKIRRYAEQSPSWEAMYNSATKIVLILWN